MKNMTYPMKIYPSQGLKLPFSLSFYPLSQTTNFGLKNLSFYPIQKLLIPKKDILLSQNFILSFGISLCTVWSEGGGVNVKIFPVTHLTCLNLFIDLLAIWRAASRDNRSFSDGTIF